MPYKCFHETRCPFYDKKLLVLKHFTNLEYYYEINIKYIKENLHYIQKSKILI